MAFKDIRQFIKKAEEIKQVKYLKNVDWNIELGAISEMMVEANGPVLVFDEIKGYPPGYRVAVNSYTTVERQLLALGMPTGLGPMDYIKKWREITNAYKPVKPVEVKTGPILENVQEGKNIDLFKFPVPKWHELDGGRYIGTGDMVITQDPDEGWVNFGTYRQMLHDKSTVGFYVSPMQHANQMRRKYWAKGQPCPVAVVYGQEPSLAAAATYWVPWGVSEYDFAGHIRGAPVKVIKGPVTGLPIPADAEIAIEGFAPPPEVESRVEGPFGEWTGYYGHGARPEPIINVKSVMFRNNPILEGSPPYRPPYSYTFDLWTWRAARTWDQLEAAGVPEVRGVYATPAGGSGTINVISIKQVYGGHARQAGHVAAGCGGSAYMTRFIIIVDEDIDPSNTDEVMWAMGTRCDPATSIDVMSDCLASALDPRMDPDKKLKGDLTNSRAIIYACRPFSWFNKYPAVNKVGPDVRNQVLKKWGSQLGLKKPG